MALSFDGTNDTVDHSDILAIDGTAVFTIMGWVMVDTLELNSYFWGKTNGDRTFGFGARAATDNTSAEVIIGSGGAVSQSRTATGMITAGEWAHWAFVYAGAGATADDKVKIYKNGVNLGALTHSATPAATLPAGTGVLAAARNQRDGVFLDCKLGHMKAWLAALTETEVRNEVWKYRPQRETNILIWSPYDDGTTTAGDYCGNAATFPGTITEATADPGPPGIRYDTPPFFMRRDTRRAMLRPERRVPYVTQISRRLPHS